MGVVLLCFVLSKNVLGIVNCCVVKMAISSSSWERTLTRLAATPPSDKVC